MGGGRGVGCLGLLVFFCKKKTGCGCCLEWGFEDECFFWLGKGDLRSTFRRIAFKKGHVKWVGV